MLEIEIKLRLADADAFRAQLDARGWSADPTVSEKNTIYDTPEKELRDSGRLLRIRDIDDRAIVTVKLPAASGGPHKVRDERQFETDGVEAAGGVFQGLGYEPAWIYEKRRTTYRKAGEAGIIELDETPIGEFAELEGAPEWIDRTAAEFGFGKGDYLSDTYRDLFEVWLEQTGSTATHMVFDDA